MFKMMTMKMKLMILIRYLYFMYYFGCDVNNLCNILKNKCLFLINQNIENFNNMKKYIFIYFIGVRKDRYRPWTHNRNSKN